MRRAIEAGRICKVSARPVYRLRWLTTISGHGELPKGSPARPPRARRGDGPDPYAWLEQQTDEVLEYLKSENRYTTAMMRGTQGLQKALYKEMAARLDRHGRTAAPERCLGFWYYMRREEGKNFPVYYRSREKPTPDSAGYRARDEAVLLDQNELPEFYHYFHVGDLKVSPDNGMLAFTLAAHDSTAGVGTLYVRDLSSSSAAAAGGGGGRWWTSECWARVSGFEWAGSHAIAFTTDDRLGRPCDVHVAELDSDRRGLRRAVSSVYHEGDPQFFVGLRRTKDGRFVTINCNSKTTSEVWLLPTPASSSSPPRLLRSRVSGVQYFVEHGAGNHFYIVTNDLHPDGEYDLCHCPSSSATGGDGALGPWERVAGGRGRQQQEVLEDLDLFRHFCVLYLRTKGGVPALRVLRLGGGASPVEQQEGKEAGDDVALPGEAAVGKLLPGLNQDYDATRVRFSVMSPICPRVTYEYDMERRQLSVVEREPVWGLPPVQPLERYVCERVCVTPTAAASSVPVPMTLAHKRGVARDGSRPVLLVGYGAYGVSVDVSFRPDYLPLLDRGWLLAFAHVRGGGEMGRAWHVAGRGRAKANSISDYLDCARWLVQHGYTSPGRLAAYGSSAGGLLVGSAVNRMPELFGAVVLKVPFLDIARTMADPSLPLTVHEYDEWGDPSTDPTALDRMRSYSPYDTIPASAPSFPDTLVLASLADDRVRYWEAAKYVAKARHALPGHPLVLLRTECDRGHSGHASQTEMLQESAFEWAFLLRSLGLDESQSAEEAQADARGQQRGGSLATGRRARRRNRESPFLHPPFLSWPNK